MRRPGKLTTLFATALCALLLALPASADDLTLEQLLDRHFEAIGGVDAWKAVQTAEIQGKMVMAGGQMEAPISIRFKRPGKARIEFTLQGMTGVQATDGETYWMVMPFMGQTAPEKMADDQAKQFAQQAEFESEFLDWEAKGHQVELVGRTDVEGTPAYEVKLTREGGDTQTIFLDAEYYVPIRMVTKADVQGMEMEMETTIGDYKEIDGLVMAHSIESRAKGASAPMQSIQFESVTFGQDIDDSVFAMPEAPAPAAAAEAKE